MEQVEVRFNDPDAPLEGDENVEFTFWFTLDGSQSIQDVSDRILFTLENTDIPGIRRRSTYRSPFAKLYAP